MHLIKGIVEFCRKLPAHSSKLRAVRLSNLFPIFNSREWKSLPLQRFEEKYEKYLLSKAPRDVLQSKGCKDSWKAAVEQSTWENSEAFNSLEPFTSPDFELVLHDKYWKQCQDRLKTVEGQTVHRHA